MERLITAESGIGSTRELGKYLGMPILQKRINKTTYGEVLEKVSSRLAGWKSKTLSMAGRITLTKSVLFSILVHSMSSSLLSAETLESLDKLSRSFVWGSTVEKRKQHLLASGKVCRPKREGGLGLKEARVMNKALLAKVGWRLLSNKSSLWTKVLRIKYIVGEVHDHSWVVPKSKWSSRWRSIGVGLREVVSRGIGGGAHAFVWRGSLSGYGYGGSGESQSISLDSLSSSYHDKYGEGQANERGNWVTLFSMAVWWELAVEVTKAHEKANVDSRTYGVQAGGVESGLGVGGRFSLVKSKRGSSSILPDGLAAYAFSLYFGFLSLAECPDVVNLIMLEDVSGTAFPLTTCSLLQAFLDGVAEEVSAAVVGLAPQPSSVIEPWTAATRERSMVMVVQGLCLLELGGGRCSAA
ncbi:hypothetical protein ISN45_Aa08g007260 [Arabidopsis thaliana x Arabidopsis arenosa]|uniref:Uncharacterized protein n=1 Tax=Arabidopsis thaliana x Arabidopsis arenosa TaxID=1240361 RepID=A0A8T1XKG5_9BRAS|nr:hypothetical protein ISN45_Aa08g007260 [Arabidopsis thaliana x Arabidopsis arenosa]